MLAASKENLRKTSKWFERSEGDFVMGNGPCCAETSLIAEVINCFKHEALPAPSLPNWIVSSLGVYQCHAGAIQGADEPGVSTGVIQRSVWGTSS